MSDSGEGYTRVAFPLWMPVGSDTTTPFEERSGSMTCLSLTVAGVENVIPLFTSNVLLERFIAEGSANAAVAEVIDTPRKLIGVLDWLQSRQRTHVAFDPIPTKHNIPLFPITDVVQAARDSADGVLVLRPGAAGG